MLPINPRELQRQLKQLKKMGMKIEQLENVNEVVIKLGDRRMILENPDVTVFELASQKMFYIVPKMIREEVVGEEVKASATAIREEDIRFIVEFTGVSYEVAKEALTKAGGDIAKAIEILQTKDKDK